MGLDGLDFGFLWIDILDSDGFGLDLDWLVGLAWWAVVVAWWVVGCLVVFAMGLLGFVLFFLFFIFWVFGSGGFGEQRAVVTWWAWWWRGG